jgi:hypothetical protein
MRRYVLSAVVAAIAMFGIAIGTGSTSAQTEQNGLVNVYLNDVTVQVPIAVAANVCDVTVGVLARQLDAGDVTCDSGATATAIDSDHGNGGPVQQGGLVNLAASDLTIQVPVVVAADLCDINVAVLAGQLGLGDTTCNAVDGASARG